MPIFVDEDDVSLENSNTDTTGNTSTGIYNIQTTHNFRTNEEMDISIRTNKDQKLEYMVANLKGYRWSVDYFLNIATINDNLTPPDVNTPNTIQKYNRIDKLELLVQTPIDQSGNIEDIKGESIINSGFLPHVNDVFLAELTGGRQALFKIDTLEVKTYNLRDAYYVTYSLFTLLDNENIEKYNDLVYKTINQYVYDKEHLLDYSAPIILSTDYKKKLNLKSELNTLIKYYCKKFIDNETKLFIIPTDISKYYDSYISDFIFKIFDINTVPEMLTLSRVHDNLDRQEYSIWDSLINRDSSILSLANDSLWYRVVINNNNAILKSLGYLGVNFVLDKVDNNLTPLTITETLDNIITQPVTHTSNRKYVLSENFYKKDKTKTTTFEKMVISYLDGSMLNIKDIEESITNYSKWSIENQFYCIPILIMLVKDSINNTFTRL